MPFCIYILYICGCLNILLIFSFQDGLACFVSIFDLFMYVHCTFEQPKLHSQNFVKWVFLFNNHVFVWCFCTKRPFYKHSQDCNERTISFGGAALMGSLQMPHGTLGIFKLDIVWLCMAYLDHVSPALYIAHCSANHFVLILDLF